jgi:hypothetical protein
MGEISDLSNTIAGATEEQTATISEIDSALETGMEELKELSTMAHTLKEETVHFSDGVTGALGSQDVIVELAGQLETVAGYFRVSDDAVNMAAVQAGRQVRLLYATLKHFHWKKEIIISVLQGKSSRIIHDPSKCAMGMFIENDRMGDVSAAERQLLDNIDSIHKMLHQYGRQIMDMLDQGDVVGARSFYAENIRELFDRMLDNLTQLRQIMEQGAEL